MQIWTLNSTLTGASFDEQKNIVLFYVLGKQFEVHSFGSSECSLWVWPQQWQSQNISGSFFPAPPSYSLEPLHRRNVSDPPLGWTQAEMILFQSNGRSIVVLTTCTCRHFIDSWVFSILHWGGSLWVWNFSAHRWISKNRIPEIEFMGQNIEPFFFCLERKWAWERGRQAEGEKERESKF